MIDKIDGIKIKPFKHQAVLVGQITKQIESGFSKI